MIEQKTEQVPWTLQQTYIGILFTLIPWLVFSILLSSGNSALPSKPLSPAEDLAGAIITFIFATLVEATFLIAPFYFARHAYRRIMNALPTWSQALQTLGFRKAPLRQSVMLVSAFFVLILLVNLGYSYLLTLLHQLAPSINLQTNDVRVCAQSKIAPLTTDATLLVAFLVAPLCEELFFRGFVFMGLLRGMSLTGAILFSALIFGVAHADVPSFLVLFIIGLMLAYLRWKTRSIWPSITLHMLNNGSSALLIFLASRGVINC
ncbi:MAG: CPBP family intramembrane metalloprotease [Ktedonobacteraceae bacterium]|nr:CPBP family intramembrane metalloprotease [Ktedonobacteraceae bacterium]